MNTNKILLLLVDMKKEIYSGIMICHDNDLKSATLIGHDTSLSSDIMIVHEND